MRFVVPTTFAERVDGDLSVSGDLDAVSLDLELDVDMPSAVERIESVTHGAALDVALAGRTARVGLKATDNAALDVVLLLKLAAPRTPFIAVERNAPRTSASLMATFFPQFESPPAPLDVELLFLIDWYVDLVVCC